MRTVVCDGIGAVSALGFGCASLGSRVSEKNGRAAIERALAAGITWFDVAPSYGDGNAERILGEALRGTSAQIATKAGIVAPPVGGAKRFAGLIARPLVDAIPALRPLVRNMRGSAARHIPLDGETIRASLSRSLEGLRRGHVAMLALHGPSLEDVRSEGVIRALADIKSQGLAKQIGIAGSIEAFNAAREAGLDAAIAQIANDPFDRAIDHLAMPRPFTVTHSVFGVAGALDHLKKLMNSAEMRLRFAGIGYGDPSALLLDYAFAANPSGIVLASSYGAGHLATNVAAAALPPDPALMERLDAALTG